MIYVQVTMKAPPIQKGQFGRLVYELKWEAKSIIEVLLDGEWKRFKIGNHALQEVIWGIPEEILAEDDTN